MSALQIARQKALHLPMWSSARGRLEPEDSLHLSISSPSALLEKIEGYRAGRFVGGAFLVPHRPEKAGQAPVSLYFSGAARFRVVGRWSHLPVRSAQVVCHRQTAPHTLQAF